MSKLLKILVLIVSCSVLSACTCTTPLVVTEIQRSDKNLTCKDIILEINESEHFKEKANREKGIGFGNALMPVCWLSSYADTSKAVNAANARIAYLGNIYDVLDCGGKSDLPEGMSSAPRSSAAPAHIGRQSGARQRQYPSLKNVVNDDTPMVPGEADDSMVRSNIHKHMDKSAKTYSHSHYHAGPHRHGSDQ